MQFPKAKRFLDIPNDDIPPVGAYSVAAPSDPAYKRGAMLEKEKRFHDPNVQQPDTLGLYVATEDKENGLKKPRSSIVAGAGIERMQKQMDDLKTRLNNQHEKEVAKLQSKIARLETSREEGVKERQEMSKELLGLKSELRSVTTREQSIAGKLAKAESSLTKHQALLPTLQTKLDQLNTSHTESRKRKDAEIAALNEKLEKKEVELSNLREEAKDNRRALREEKWAREESTKVAEKTIKELKERSRSALLEQGLEHGRTVARLEGDLRMKQQQLSDTIEVANEAKERAEMAEEDLLDLQDVFDLLMDERARDRDEPRGEKDWRQRARSDQRDSIGLREDVDHLLSCAEVDRDIKDATAWLNAVQLGEVEARCNEFEKELEVVEGELDLAVNDEIPRLEDALDLSNEGLEEMRDRVLDLQSALEDKDGEVKELQARAIAEIERFEGTLEEQHRRYEEKEKDVEKERAEKRRVTALLGQARSAEAALKEENERLVSALQEAEDLKATHRNLVANLDYLARENAATREDNVLLVEQNAELASHQNSRQKIQVHAMTRAQLADSRRAQLAVTSKLASSEARVAQLESELQTYKSVSSHPFATTSTMAKSTGRIRLTRPVLTDANSLPPTPSPMSLSDSLAMPPPPVHSIKSSVAFAGIGVDDDEELFVDSRKAQRATGSLDQRDDAREVGTSGTGSDPRSRRMSNGGMRMVGKMSISELL